MQYDAMAKQPKKETCLEMFKLDKKIQPRKFFVYRMNIATKAPDMQKERLFRLAARQLNKRYVRSQYVAVTDFDRVYTVKKIEEEHLSFKSAGKADLCEFSLEFDAEEVVPLSNHRVYEDFIYRLLLHRVRYARPGGVPFYDVLGDVVSTEFVKPAAPGTPLAFRRAADPQNHFRMKRKYGMKVHTTDEGEVFLELNTKGIFESTDTLYDMKKRGEDIDHLPVKYTLDTSFPQSGFVEMDADVDFGGREQLMGYLSKKYAANPVICNAVQAIPADDEPVPVRLKNGKVLSYLSSCLKLIVTTEVISKRANRFFYEIQKLIKRPMQERFRLDEEFVEHIGKIDMLDDAEFLPNPVTAEELQYEELHLPLPMLLVGNGGKIQAEERAKNAIFQPRFGYYKKPALTDGHFHVAIVHDDSFGMGDGTRLLSYLYVQDGGALAANLPNVKGTMIQHEYSFPKNATTLQVNMLIDEIQKASPVDVVLAMLPKEGALVHIPDAYDELKKALCNHGIPSQMVEYENVIKMISTYMSVHRHDKRFHADSSMQYNAKNITMGLLGKVGAIPYVAEHIPGDVDLFLGIDVAMSEKGIHYPSCSIITDAQGQVLGFMQTQLAQKGEIIDTRSLRSFLDGALLRYSQLHDGKHAKKIVIHRDGFSHEDSSWYEDYFQSNGLDASIFEVRKSGATRIGTNIGNQNPEIGTVLIKGDMALMVTTHPAEKLGASKPILVEKVSGSVDIRTAVEQIYCLTKLHVGARQNTRLPITTRYADTACKSVGYVPQGTLCDKLYFL